MSFLRDFHDLLAGAGVVGPEEPKAACPRHRCEVAPSRRLYFAFSRPQTCAFCGEAVGEDEALAFD